MRVTDEDLGAWVPELEKLCVQTANMLAVPLLLSMSRLRLDMP